MAVAVEQIAKVALDRIKSAREEVENISGYASTIDHKVTAKRDLDIAVELLALIVPSPQPAPPTDVPA